MLLILVHLRKELIWYYQDGASRIFPDKWESYVEPIPEVSTATLWRWTAWMLVLSVHRFFPPQVLWFCYDGRAPWKTCSIRAVPEIILGGAHFFWRPLHPQDTHGVGAPPPPGHVSALINLPHYGSNMPWPPGQITPPSPTPRTYCQQNTLPPPDKKVSAAHPFPRIILEQPLDYKLGWPMCTRPCFQVERFDMMSAYYRRLTGDDEDVKLKCARSWSNWEMSTSRLLEDKDMLKRTESDTFALQFARIEWWVGNIIINISVWKNIPRFVVGRASGVLVIFQPLFCPWRLLPLWWPDPRRCTQDPRHSMHYRTGSIWCGLPCWYSMATS